MFRNYICLIKDVPLVEISTNSSHICGRKDPDPAKKPLKTAQKKSKIVLSAGMKLFEISKLENYLINFIRILWFICDLGLVLFDSHKDVVSGKKFGFGNILGFLGENWAQKWTKTINFGYVLFPLKHLILKDCSETVWDCSEIVFWKTYLWLKFQQNRVTFAGERSQKPPKRTIS